MSDLQITPKELKQRLERGDKIVLVDVREPHEYEICRIEGARLVPLKTIPAKISTFEGAGEVICYCHHGIRSLDAASWLRKQGVAGARSLAGGIERWSREVDPRVPRY